MTKFLCITILIFTNINTASAFERILFLGDSHSYGQCGKALDKYFRSIAQEVVTVSSCGSSPSTWTTQGKNFQTTNCGYWRKDNHSETRVKSHQLNSHQNEDQDFNPDLTVISLGTNILSSQTSINRELPQIKKMAELAKKNGRECIWIGPPDLQKNPFKSNLKKGIEELRSTVEAASCKFIDSTQLTKYPPGNSDGIHYGPTESRQWGEAIQHEIDKKLKLDSATMKRPSSAPKKKEPTETGTN